MKNIKTGLKNTALAAMFLSLGMLLPLFTGQIKEIGDSLLPMHIPVMLCGLLCGWQYGAAVGLILPFLRSVIFTMPPIYPNAVWMSFELATYGFVIGLMYSKIKKKNTFTLYLSLIVSMISGRIVWGVSKNILLGLGGKTFTVNMFFIGGIIDAVPGIILQLIIIPIIIKVIENCQSRKNASNGSDYAK